MQKIVLAFLLILTGCATTSNMNEFPMYGHQEKPADLNRADSVFIHEITKTMSRDSGSILFANKGFHYLNSGDPITAIKRFNQSWLLDSTNFMPYWGFASYYRIIKMPEDSVLAFFEKAYSLNSKNCDLAHQTVTSNYFLKSQNKPYKADLVERILTELPDLDCPNDENDYKQAVCEFGLEQKLGMECN